jgi:hypothetical protein
MQCIPWQLAPLMLCDRHQRNAGAIDALAAASKMLSCM